MNETFDKSSTQGPSEMSPKLPTIYSAEESTNIPDSPNKNAAQSSRLVDGVDAYELKLAKMCDEIEARFNAMMKMFVLTLKTKSEQCADPKVLDDLVNNMWTDLRNKHQNINSEPPPLPPRPNKIDAKLTGSHELQNEQKIKNFNDNDNNKENKNVPNHLQKCDVNMNCAENTFDYSTTANQLMTPFYNLDYQLPLKNDNQLNSAMWNDNIYNETHETSLISQAPSTINFQDFTVFDKTPATFQSNQHENLLTISQQTQIKDSINLITPRESFEMSLEESAKSFFARLEAKCKPKNQETNPFKIANENDKFEEKNALPFASSLPTRNSTLNPFVPKIYESQEDKISPTRIVYSAGPIKYDFPMTNKTHGELDAAAAASKSVEMERDHFEATRQTNVASWITQSVNSKPNYVDKDQYNVSIGKQPFFQSFTGDFPKRIVNSSVTDDVKPDYVLPLISSRPEASFCESLINNEVFKASIADLDSISEPDANHVESELLRAASGEMEFPSTESLTKNVERYGEKDRRNNGDELQLTAEIKRQKMIGKEETDSGNLAAERKAEDLSMKKTWDYKEIHLTKQTVHLINLDNEGWLTVEEIMTTFTTFKMTVAILKILDIRKADIPFRYINRVDHKTLFDQLERTSLAVPRNHKNEIGNVLHLAPIRSLLKILRKLRIAGCSKASIELATKKNIFPSKTSALYNALTIIYIYATGQRNIQS